MKEIGTKSDAREMGKMSESPKLPPERFNPNKPCDNIRQVVFKDNMWKIFYTKGTIPVDSIPKQRFGDFKCNGKDWLLFERPNTSGTGLVYNVCDSKGKPLSPQTNNLNSDKIGKFVSQSGENMTFEKDNMYKTYDKNFKQVGSTILKPKS